MQRDSNCGGAGACRLPTAGEVNALVRFLPGFAAPERRFIKEMKGGATDDEGVFVLPVPAYEDDVNTFFEILSKEPWIERNYLTERTTHLVAHPEEVRIANLDEVRAVLTHCCRGERFSDGHWNAMLTGGIVQAALRRLQKLFAPSSGTRA
jgi:hypothetical protein